MVAPRRPVAVATCPPGKALTGGGGHCSTLGPIENSFVYVVNNYPISNTQWEVSCDTLKFDQVTAVACAICC